jgi:hypothetical protein
VVEGDGGVVESVVVDDGVVVNDVVEEDGVASDVEVIGKLDGVIPTTLPTTEML